MDRPRGGAHRGPRDRRFNGATSFQKWIDYAGARIPFGAAVFQWGHFFSEMDSSAMGPLSFRGHGFNGATSFQKWIDCESCRQAGDGEAVSMGPLLFRNG